MARIVIAAIILLVPGTNNIGFTQKKSDHPAPLFEKLGNHRHPISSKSKLAQRYFDQGLVLLYGFNHKEAIRSFQAGAKLDPDCAIFYWGVALAYGPNINKPMSKEEAAKAYKALQKAIQLAPKANQAEKDYIQALSKRYVAKPGKDRKKLDIAYANAMRKLWKKYPEDLDAATLFAEALMDITPWDYYTKEGKNKKWTGEIVSTLEYVLKRNPNHPGANHYYIHAVEASPNPERGLGPAMRLRTLCPDAGHLVHMPSHIFLRLGMYHDASNTNVHAIRADESYITQCKAQGFYPAIYYSHNVHFLWYCLSVEGRSKECIRAGRKTSAVLSKKNVQDMPFLQWLKATPTFALIRFGKWQEILDLAKPDRGAQFETAMYHYARGLAFTRLRKLAPAKKEMKLLQRIAKDKATEKLEMPIFPGASVVKLADLILQAEVNGLQGNHKDRIQGLTKAVEMQVSLPYMEPPFWYFPVRQLLGKALLEANELARAEKIYRQDLVKHPNNGWSLFGLLQTLRQQGKFIEAREVERQFQDAWKYADITLTTSCF